ncbi:hypothetical protein HCJ45_07730 [Listeria sp. FSL L7-1517]|uniref:hypothetical protein n=1 Tax=Listeria immobilis TaxID=2713502 RepID=UPI00164D1CC8|nr:hypothetical protein [Listeria immobilis]MBC6296990.1 hypothetical protein [Listeria immobilis]
MYETMIAKATSHALLGIDSHLVYGSFTYHIEGESMDLDGLWISNEDALIFYLENDDVYLMTKIAYVDMHKLEHKVSIISMTKKLILRLKNKENYTLLVAHGEAKGFADCVNKRIQKVSLG